MTSFRVYIATTQGPSEVQRIAMEDPHVRSVVCLNGTSEALPISAAYDAFVRKPTGVIENKYGHPVYRVDVSERISDGKSWQLGLFAAHGLLAANLLAGKGEKAKRAVWLTGEVDRDLNVNPVDHVAEKLRQSAPLFAELKAAGIPLTIFVPHENTEGYKPAWGTVVGLESVTEMYRELGLTEEKKSTKSRSIAPFIGLGVLFAAIAGAALWQGNILEQFSQDQNTDVAIVAEGKPVLKNPSIELTAIEHRSPGRCPVTFFGGAAYNLVALDKADTENFAASAWENLCAVKYGFYNASEKPVHAWITLIRSGSEHPFSRQQIFPGPIYRQLAPGENIFTTLVLPRWSKKPLTIQVVAALGLAIPQQVEKWLDNAETDNLRHAGLTVRTLKHVINPPKKPRFN